MNNFYDADDFNEELTDDEQEEAVIAYEVMMAQEFDALYARSAWETMQETQEGDGFLHLT